jgi:hypothetical protein
MGPLNTRQQCQSAGFTRTLFALHKAFRKLPAAQGLVNNSKGSM